MHLYSPPPMFTLESFIMDGVINAYDLPMLYSYQALTYFYAAMAFLWLYDYGLTFDEEFVYLRKSKWGATKAFFITARYSTFGVFLFRVYMDSMYYSINDCHSFDLTVRVFTLLSIGCSEGLYIIRAYALWRKSKRILTLILVTFSACVISVAVVGFSSGGSTTFSKSPVSTLTGCYLTSQGNLMYVMFIVLIVFELELVILVGIQVVKSYRESGSHLLKVLVQQNATYYACGLLSSAVNIFAVLLLKVAKDDFCTFNTH
ncbi:hypothetical protein DFH29DRAFT_300223 [Suillus ampliporus]|nr:hypothetical protein DFH29DRAFT_300223 [Suillus ampliporus]